MDASFMLGHAKFLHDAGYASLALDRKIAEKARRCSVARSCGSPQRMRLKGEEESISEITASTSVGSLLRKAATLPDLNEFREVLKKAQEA